MLPFGVATRYSDGRRKFKKSSSSHAEQAVDAAPKVSKQSKVPNFFLELEKKDAIFSGSEVGVSSEVVKEEEDEEEKPMEIDSVGGLSTAETSTLPIPEG
ncbi:uncharacterized protein A4U43_C08F20870 [Asparagus officinalis]|nr:uncharacterized protein A4U43_C08F20870 [Asparagus officinalis]